MRKRNRKRADLPVNSLCISFSLSIISALQISLQKVLPEPVNSMVLNCIETHRCSLSPQKHTGCWGHCSAVPGIRSIFRQFIPIRSIYIGYIKIACFGKCNTGKSKIGSGVIYHMLPGPGDWIFCFHPGNSSFPEDNKRNIILHGNGTVRRTARCHLAFIDQNCPLLCIGGLNERKNKKSEKRIWKNTGLILELMALHSLVSYSSLNFGQNENTWQGSRNRPVLSLEKRRRKRKRAESEGALSSLSHFHLPHSPWTLSQTAMKSGGG